MGPGAGLGPGVELGPVERAREGIPCVSSTPSAPGQVIPTIGLPEPDTETFTIHLKGEGDKGQLKMVWGKTALMADFAGQ